MSKGNKFEEFLKKDGNDYLGFLKRYAVMDDRTLLDREDFYYRQALSYIKLALFYLGEYEKANYAKYLQSLDFDMGDFTYAECISADINGLFTEATKSTQERLVRDYERLLRFLEDGNKRYLKNNVFFD